MATMKAILTLAVALALVATSWAAAQSTDEQTEAIAAAGKMFQTNCSTCHQIPDLQFEVDRAWLKQVQDTA